MTAEVGGMIAAGAAVLVAGAVLVRPRFQEASGAARVLVLGPLCDAIALAIFATEHFTAAHGLAPMVPHWLPAHLFWVYFVGIAWLAAAISFILWRCVEWSAPHVALMMLLIVATLDVPNVAAGFHQRFFWILLVREMSFAGGAMVLGGSVWPTANRWATALMRIGRSIVAAVMIFYASQHFLFPRHVLGVPLEKLTPAWVPAPVLLAWVVGIALLLGGTGLFFRRFIRGAATGAGTVLLLVTVFYYLPILVVEFHTAPVEGLNYVGDTLLFAGTVLLAGLGANPVQSGNSSRPSLLRSTQVSA
ncbi:MAG TPA: hypothetical protein VME18_08000 [Acidobacteriaceae bacterium]|nr:hypothetical protein [Acidobacteriaceae bacterium]